MVGLKRFVRHGLVISALAHAGVLAIGLLFVRASPHEAVLPDAMLVEVVTPKEVPRLSGTPSALRTSGTERAAPSQPGTAMSQPPQPPRPPQPKTVPTPPEPKQQHQPQRTASPKPPEPQTAPPQPQEPQMAQAEAAPIAMPKPPSPDPPAPAAEATPAPAAEATPDAPETAAMQAQLALLGGRLGGGFAAPPVDSPLVGYDFTELFRQRVSSCAPLPPGFAPTDKISVRMRVFLNRDGTLSAPPQLLEPNPSAKQETLMRTFVSGLEKCQPYTMLPPDKYKQWKSLDLVVFPLNAYGG